MKALPEKFFQNIVWKSVLLITLFLFPAASGNCSDEIVLFDGQSMDGWAHTGPGYFGLDEREHCLISRNGMGMLFYYDQKFDDFDLTLEWSVNREKANSGVFVRFPNLPKKKRPADAQGRNLSGPWGAVNEGYEIQIMWEDTGSLYSFSAAKPPRLKEVGAWNKMRIRAVGQHYEVWINGDKVGDYQGKRALSGYVGIQNHDKTSIVRFRNIRITPLEK